MAELRGAGVQSAEALKQMAASLSGFSERAVDTACARIETSEPDPYSPRMPSLGQLLEACRKASVTVKHTRFCGRCHDGYIRVSGEVVMCECCCNKCGGLGLVFVTRNGEQYAAYCDCHPAKQKQEGAA